MGLQGPVSLLSHHYIDMVVFKLLILMLIVEFIDEIRLIKEIGKFSFHILFNYFGAKAKPTKGKVRTYIFSWKTAVHTSYRAEKQ